MQSFHAIGYGQDGQLVVDQTIESSNLYITKSSKNPLSRTQEEVVENFAKALFLDSVCTSSLPSSKAVISEDWTEFHKAFYKNSTKRNQVAGLVATTVDVFGIFNSGIRKFIFRNVIGEKAKLIMNESNKRIPSTDELNKAVIEAIGLTKIICPDGRARAAWKTLSPIAFYYLPVGKELAITLDSDNKINLKAEKKPLIFVYPILPALSKEKTSLIVDLLKQQWSESIDIYSVDQHPIEIDEPPTIRSVP